MEYYAAVRRDEVMKFAYKCISMETIMLSEMSQRGTDIEGLHSFVECGVASHETDTQGW